MKKINIEIKNSYGIAVFKESLEFSQSAILPHNDTHIIYAQNGVMKSSLTKTLLNYSKPGTEIKDYIFNKSGSCKIEDDLGNKISENSILSVPSFDNSIYSKCEKISDLLVSEDLKKRYDALTQQHTTALFELLHKLKDVSRIKSSASIDDVVKAYCLSFGPSTPTNHKNFVALISTYYDSIEAAEDFIANVPYKVAGEQYVLDFAEKNGNFLSSFVEKYAEVLRTSAYMRGDFGTKGADEVAKVLDKQNFFSAQHSVTLLDKSDPLKSVKHNVNTAQELSALFESDFDRVFKESPKLKKDFKRILAKLDQANHFDLKKLLEKSDTSRLITLMASHSQLRKNLWFGYLKQCKKEIDTLLEIDSRIKPDIEEIISESENEHTTWDIAIEVFNRRFKHMPFRLRVSNRPSIILEDVQEVALEYLYLRDGKEDTGHPLEPQELLKYLSTGERKAFYLLNTLFEIYSRRQQGNDNIIILDDIVDSFDYKNKYAFLEYIYELSKEDNNLKIIILTHNFDFFRLLQSRMFGDNRKHSWFGERSKKGFVKLSEAGQFHYYKNTRTQAPTHGVAWLSLIPLTRNLIEYRVDNPSEDSDFVKLTGCMHHLDANCTVLEASKIIKKYTGISGSPYDSGDYIHDKILFEADNLPALNAHNLLHNKVVLALACRLRSEKYIKNLLTPAQIDIARSKNANFTRELCNQYTLITGYLQSTREIFEEVNLITPENIHINAFMYEPLIDLSQDELDDLYKKIKAL